MHIKTKPKPSGYLSAIHNGESSPLNSIHASDPGGQAVPAQMGRWVRVSTATRYAAVGRSTLYEYVKLALVKSCCLKLSADKRGRRLIFLPSLMTLLGINAEIQSSNMNGLTETQDGIESQEWMRVNTALRWIEISRSSLYQFTDRGLVKSCSLKKKGTMKGVRLINMPSFFALLESAANNK